MADELDAGSAGGEEHLDDAQAGKNTTLRTRAKASELARDERMNKPAVQNLLRRGRQGNRMIGASMSDEDDAPTRSQKWYGKKED